MRTRSIAKSRGQRSAVGERERLIEQSLSLVCVAGFDGFLKRISPALCAAFGYTEAEMTSVPMIELIHPLDRPWSAQVVATLAKGEPAHGGEVRVRTKDGGYRWVLWNGIPCLESQVFFATGQDITARKAIEEQLRESQERFHLLASATDEAVWDWDLRTGRVWSNEGYRQAFGEPMHEADGLIDWWRRRIHPDDVDRILAQIPAPIVDGRQQWTLEYRLQRRDGTYAHVYDRGFVIFDREDKPVRMVGSMIDISRLKQAEEELRESDERFRLAARATRDVIWDWDMRRGHVWRSEGFESVFGYAPDAVSRDLAWWIEHTHADDRERVCAQIASVCAERLEQYSVEYRFRRADGSYADVFERAFVMYDGAGRPVRMVGSLMDISDRRRAEEILSMQQAELAHIARISTTGEIATGLAHELNQPLAAIANYAESCLQALSAPTADSQQMLRGWIERIATNTHRAGEIIRRLRGFTRKSPPRRECVDVNDLVGEVIELVEPETRRRKMRLRWVPGKLAQVTVDPIQIQQVLVNLLQNAFEASAEMPPERRLATIVARTVEGAIEISVADQGRGIPAEHRDRVFDAFFSTKPSGVGVGLAISRSIVEDHGGRLRLTDNPTHGVTFFFTLPISGVRHGSSTDRNGCG
jgi:PAS domain S-box-containing protein